MLAIMWARTLLAQGGGSPRPSPLGAWGGARQREECVQRPGSATARLAARDAVQVCVSLSPHSPDPQEPPAPIRPDHSTREAWSHSPRAIRLVGEIETNRRESQGGGQPKAGSPGELPGGGVPGVPGRTESPAGSSGPQGWKE